MPPKPIDIELRQFTRGSREEPYDVLVCDLYAQPRARHETTRSCE